jgi:transcription-repair coupling factor (superfamily II helicase)
VKLDGLAPGAQVSRRWIDQASERLVAYKRISRLRDERELELYRLDLEDRFGRVPEDDGDTPRFFEVLKVRLRAQALAVSEVTVQAGRLKLRRSPQTPVDPAKLMAWVRDCKDAQLNPDGAVLLPLPSSEGSAVLQAQRVLADWAALGA